MALESALVELHRMEQSLAASVERGRRGRNLVTASVNTGELPDRIAGIEEARHALRCAEVMTPRIAATELDVAARRLEFLEKRVERRQAETLIRETEARDAVAAGRRDQQAIDDWYSTTLPRNFKDGEPSDKT